MPLCNSSIFSLCDHDRRTSDGLPTYNAAGVGRSHESIHIVGSLSHDHTSRITVARLSELVSDDVHGGGQHDVEFRVVVLHRAHGRSTSSTGGLPLNAHFLAFG